MKQFTKYSLFIAFLLILIGSCKKKDYSMGDLTAPSEVTITTKVIGQDATHPNGDGSGDVEISVTGKNVLSYKIGYDSSATTLEHLPKGKVVHTYSKDGLNNYRITVVAYGPGATATTVTKDVQVRSDFKPDAAIITNLTGTGSKTWKVDKDISAHFGVGPWSKTSVTPEWYAAAPNEKAGCCNCFYSATFTFTKTATGFTLSTATPDGAFTKTGSLAGGLPGIPASGSEACYSYGGGTSPFTFVRPTSGISTGMKASILLGGNNT
ncbi:MAG TPA: hypothetical protein VM187_13565, partial [Niastella sp.]|nr:hypothetical protein [Niastella sp.]